MLAMDAPRPTPHELRTLAVRTHRDPRSVANVLAQRGAKAVVRTQVLEAVRELGWLHLLGASSVPVCAEVAPTH